jgi:hypothetical protein
MKDYLIYAIVSIHYYRPFKETKNVKIIQHCYFAVLLMFNVVAPIFQIGIEKAVRNLSAMKYYGLNKDVFKSIQHNKLKIPWVRNRNREKHIYFGFNVLFLLYLASFDISMGSS